MPTATSATPMEWRKVKGDLASTTSAKASQMVSMRLAGSSSWLPGSAASTAARGEVLVVAGRALEEEQAALEEGLRGVNEGGIEPFTAALLEHGERLHRATAAAEDVEVLGDGGDAREQGNGIAFAAFRIAGSVPMLVEAAYAFGGEVAHAEFADDLRATVAAQLDHLFIVLVLGETDLDDPQGLAERPLTGNGLAVEQLERGE